MRRSVNGIEIAGADEEADKFPGYIAKIDVKYLEIVQSVR